MSFSDLSRELRNIIYYELLCPPDGVHLQHLDWDRRMKKFKADVFSSSIDRADGNSEQNENDDLDVDMERHQVEELMKAR